MSRMSQETLGKSRMGRGTLGEVWDGSKEPPGGSGRVEGTSRRSGTGRETIEEVREGSRDL